MGYIYLWYHKSYSGIYKMGKTQDLIKRSHTYITGEYTRGYYAFIAHILPDSASSIDHHEAEELLQEHYADYHRYDNGGTEFYDSVIINTIVEVLNKCNIKFKTYDTVELAKISHDINNDFIARILSKHIKRTAKHNYKNKYLIQNEHKLLWTSVMVELLNHGRNIITKFRNQCQHEYMLDAVKQLNKYSKVMIKAPTGFGKTHIMYKIIMLVKPKRILIFTPRILLCTQITENKYSHYIAHDNYATFHFSITHNKDSLIKNAIHKEHIIITCCYQSTHVLTKYIKKYDFGLFDLVIFDEAHYLNSNNRKYYHNYGIHELYLTATPHDYINKNPVLFGNIIEKIRIYELIQNNVLCNIETIIKKIDNVDDHGYSDLRKLIIIAMTRHNKRKGIIYVNNWRNAKTLFYLLRNDINTYLYISKDIITIKHKHKSIIHFEQDKSPAIIICIGKISYGYDNEDIDFICLADPRQSDIDIRQIVGRGLRWNHAAYPDKILHIMIPVYENELYNVHLIKYLDYIIGECGADIINKNDNYAISTNTDIKKIKAYDAIYTGCIDDIMILRQYCTTYYSMYSNFIKYIRRYYDIKSIDDYIKISIIDEIVSELHLVQRKYPKFAFIDITALNQYYKSKEECVAAIIICKEIIIRRIGKAKFQLKNNVWQFKQYLILDIRIPYIGVELYYGI